MLGSFSRDTSTTLKTCLRNPILAAAAKWMVFPHLFLSISDGSASVVIG